MSTSRLVIERVMPYKHVHDDVVQLIGSIQLFLTLLAGLALKLLEHNAVETVDNAEEEQLGVVLIVLNLFIFVASAGALYLATDAGKKRFYRSMTKVKPQDSESNVPPFAATSTKIEKA